MLTGRGWTIAAERTTRLERFQVSPDRLGPREILIRTRLSAMSPGTECSIYRATDPDVHRADGWCRYPWRAGYSGTGEILACGTAVNEYRPGDRVLGLLGHASHWVIDLDGMLGPEWSNRQVAPVAEGVSDLAAAFVRLAGIAMTSRQLLTGLRHATIGVWGLGVIGNLAAQLLRAEGHHVVGIDPVAARRKIAENCGIDETLDPGDPALAARRDEADSGSGGFDAVVDAAGHAATTIELPRFVRMGGRLALLTHWRSQPALDASGFVNAVFYRGMTVHGGIEYGPGSRPWESWPLLQFEKWATIQRLIGTGLLRIDPLVTKVARPGEHAETYRLLCERPGDLVGVAVDWRTDPTDR
jgi:threonine dehydrogenase-like Zn-dependent dehydrogenase